MVGTKYPLIIISLFSSSLKSWDNGFRSIFFERDDLNWKRGFCFAKSINPWIKARIYSLNLQIFYLVGYLIESLNLTILSAICFSWSLKFISIGLILITSCSPMYIRNPLPTCHSCERNLLTYTSQRHNTRHMFLYLITGCVIGDFPRLTI